MFELNHFGAVQILGGDAAKVVNNLCTNDIKKLDDGQACEAFITNVRGWCVEHGFILKQPNEITIVGSFGNASALCAHIDRYIVREDAKIADQSSSKAIFLLDQQEAGRSASHFDVPELKLPLGSIQSVTIASVKCTAVAVDLLNRGDVMLIAETSDRDALIESLESAGVAVNDSAEFERRRIANFWPKSGSEILEKSIPQELDRDATAISFTKGCYLGQETIARLDAIGQLQKKLCLVRFDANSPIIAGDALLKDGQQVGQITSVASDVALAYLRRGNSTWARN